MKFITILILFLSSILFADIRVYQYSGVAVDHNGKQVTLEREIDPACLDIPITQGTIWEGHYAGKEIPSACKAMFVTSVGQIQPISIHPKVETYGEMEVMHFFKAMQKDTGKILVDTRDEEWFEARTIPGAVNIPHQDINKDESMLEDFEKALKSMNVQYKKGKYDFSKAKSMVLFCNGSWCSQSPTMITKLIAMGYPPEKLKWYRGGMHDWLNLSMTSTTHKK